MKSRRTNPTPSHSCPCCGRTFEQVDDYPRVQVLAFERLPTPEAMDDTSAAAARKAIERHRRNPHESDWSRRGINMTPEIEKAARNAEVVEYLNRLDRLVGREIEPRELFPTWPADAHFKKAYRVAETPIWLSLHEGSADAASGRVTDVNALCEGPNFGSAGGPTLLVLGPVARITYCGLLQDA